ncbi:Eco57I restriction-modification methylase domain-containing protein [Spirosoma aerophilum]
MPLFQPSVLKTYLSQIDNSAVQTAWQSFHTYFGNPAIQQNIRDSKEEQFQEGFLRELFGKVFGYTLNPEPDFNLLTELKNVKDSKKADGAIVRNGQVIAVIELKSTKVTDLAVIEQQAFAYKNNQRGCTYVVTSNFEKLRFYVDDAIEFEEFNLFTLDVDRFRLLYLCLSLPTLFGGLPATIKAASTVQEENITKKLYADYSTFKQLLFADVLKQNEQYEPLLLFRKTQKLLDRFLFILFAEDRELLPPNSISEILNQWQTLRDLDEDVPLYGRFKKYFGYLNTGYKGKKHDIFAYNGGLFAPDEVLDTLIIEDQLLYEQTAKLTRYDFETDVDVNILGHIFEHSLNQLEELTAGINGRTVAYKDTKRKREGVFYTPKYITQYIVRHTLGTLCDQKKTEFRITPDDFTPDQRKAKKRELLTRLDAYRAWLLTVTVLDPACGSGAFLNEALDYLITEHRQLDEMNANLLGIPLVLSDVENSILENNIYGVDLNDESIEIAKLSLWLRTARRGRKLSSLNRNIKAGNSLIADTAVGGEKAFDWQVEFADVSANGGFDVVIGNPPYVRQELLDKNHKAYYIHQYRNVGNGTADLYVYFYERALGLLKPDGYLGYITPNKFIKAGYGKSLRGYLSSFDLQQIIDFGELPVFQDAGTFPAILIVRKASNKTTHTTFAKIQTLKFDSLENEIQSKRVTVAPEKLKQENWQLAGNDEGAIFDKMHKISVSLGMYTAGKIHYGLKTGYNEAYIIDTLTRDRLISEHPSSESVIKPFFVGDNIRKYHIEGIGKKYLIYIPWHFPYHLDQSISGASVIAEEEFKAQFPAIYNHLSSYKAELEARNKAETGIRYEWYALQRWGADYYEDFEKPKIIYPVIAKEPRFSFDRSGAYCNDKAFTIPINDFYLLAILNSKLIWSYLKRVCSVLGDEDKGGRLELRSIYLKDLPIAQTNNKEPLSTRAEMMLNQNEALQRLKGQFLQLLQTQVELPTISRKLENWPELSFKDFLAELTKQKAKLSLSQQSEWMTFLAEQQAKARTIQTVLDQTEREINQLVFELYGLTDEEISVIGN